jgi:hypothetical protein
MHSLECNLFTGNLLEVRKIVFVCPNLHTTEKIMNEAMGRIEVLFPTVT